MGFFKKIFKGFKKVFKKIGKTLKKGFGKLAKAFGKLGPLGSIALNFLVGFATAGAGNLFLKGLTTALGKMGSVGKFILNVGAKIKQGADFVKKGIGSVFNKISDGIELGLNTISKPFMKAGSRGLGSGFRDFVSNATKGFIDPSKEVNIFDKKLGLKTADGKLLSSLSRDELSALTETQLTNFKNIATATNSNNFLIANNSRTVDVLKDANGTRIQPDITGEEVLGALDKATGKQTIWDSQASLDTYTANTTTLAGNVGETATDGLVDAVDEAKQLVSEEFIRTDFSGKGDLLPKGSSITSKTSLDQPFVKADFSPENYDFTAGIGGKTEIDTSAFYKGVTEEKSSVFDSLKDTFKGGVKLTAAGSETLSGPRKYIAEQEQVQDQQDRDKKIRQAAQSELAEDLANEVLALNRADNTRAFGGSTAQFYNINDFQQGRGTVNLANFDYGVNAYHESRMVGESAYSYG